MISFPTPVENGKENLGFDMVFLVIVLLASSFSAYTTYLGFVNDLPTEASIVIAAIIGLGLFIINMKIKEYRVGGQSVARPLLAFLVFLLFSFLSNTNAFYTFFLKKDIVPQTQIKAEKDFDKGTSVILAALKKNTISVNAARTKQDLDIATRNLYNQMVDPANPGLGEKAKQHLSEIETILGIHLTKLKSPPAKASIKKHKKFADHLIGLIDEQFKTKYIVGTTEEIKEFENKIETRRTLYRQIIIDKNYKSDITDGMARDLASINIKAEKLINFKGEVPVIDTEADDIGSFNYTWTNFAKGTNKSAIILSIALSLMLDTLAPILAILLYRRKEEY